MTLPGRDLDGDSHRPLKTWTFLWGFNRIA